MKVLLVVAGVALASALVSARTIIIVKVNGGPSGFNRVSEVHTENESKLTCYGSGSTACEWTVKPQLVRGYPRLIEYAETQIAEGNLVGTYTEMIDGVPCTVRWEAQDVYNAEIVLED
ncbi:hypothetical protein HRbin21_01018 [bacterium HR21]|jgi:hypothetical protein|nr:hypothetical protein HRbin21_01018 [bacterium HR21]